MKYVCSFLICIIVITISTVYAERDIEFELVLCEDVISNLPKGIADTFQTGNKIYAYLYIDKIKNGVHKIGVYWYNTHNKLQESYIDEISVTEETYNIWSWLLLKDSQVLYDTSFIGRWKVEVYIDDDLLTKKYFNVT